MEFENLITLIKTVSDSNISELEFEQNGAKVCLKKNETVYCEVPSVVNMSAGGAVQANTKNLQCDNTEDTCEGKYIKSPLVGRFYVAPAEDADTFVHVGDSVKKGQVVAIVEAMKLMNDIESEFDGVIEEVLVENGATVEYGQKLFRVK